MVRGKATGTPAMSDGQTTILASILKKAGWRQISGPLFRKYVGLFLAVVYPGAAAGRTSLLIHPSRISLPRYGSQVGLRIVLFEACSAFTRVTACTLALSPIRDTHSEGFSHFVTSMTAPVASGWSGCRVGLAPTGKRRLVTAHTQRKTTHTLSQWSGPRRPTRDYLVRA